MFEHSAEMNEIAAALAVAQAKFDKIVKDSDNPFFKSKYANLAQIIEATRKGLTDNGIAVVQDISFAEGLCSVTTVLLHKSGQWLKGTITMPVAKMDPQGVGSVSTYARRYGLGAFVNVAADDDDANAASKPVLMDKDIKEAHLDLLENAKSIKELEVFYVNAVKDARKANDKLAEQEFIATKNATKASLDLTEKLQGSIDAQKEKIHAAK